MKKEEAKSFLIDISYKLGSMAVEYLTEKDGEKMREAIETLYQEPCEDYISRQAVIDKAVYTETEEGWSGMTVDVKDIEALPSVNPQKPKTGYISIDDVMSVFDDFMCGEVDEDGTETFL